MSYIKKINKDNGISQSVGNFVGGKIALDTNILARYFLQELNEKDNEKMENLFFKVNCKVYIDILVISELIFVLTKLYKKSREEIYEMIQILILSKNTIFDKETLEECMQIFLENQKVGFVDIMIYLNSLKNEFSPLLTFDKELLNIDNINISNL